jgi:Zn-finger nucleic acid-binding protein
VHLARWLGIDDRVWSELVQHGRRGPACTLCTAVLRTFPLKGVTVDGCEGCGALLLDPGELKTLTGMHEPPPPPTSAGSTTATSTGSTTATSTATSTATGGPAPDLSALGRVYLDPAAALSLFLGDVGWVSLVQQRQVAEALLSLEFSNRNVVQTAAGSGRIVVEEGAGAALLRMFTGGLLRSRYVLRDARDNPVLSLRRSFEKLVLSRLDVELWSGDDDGRQLGSVERSFRVLSSAYELVDAHGRRFARLERPTMSLWQFHLIDERGEVVGAIAKQWSGWATEWFTDADDFSIDLGSAPWTIEQRAVIVAAALAVDLDHFERRERNALSVFDVFD